MARAALATACALLLGGALFAGGLRALEGPRHTELTAAYPAADSLHREEIREVRLRFSTPVQRSLSAIVLLGPAGAVATGPVETVPGSDEAELRVAWSTPLPSGAYTVEWRTAGPDSHVIRGEVAFAVERPEPEPAAAPPVAPPPAVTVVDQTPVGSPAAALPPGAGGIVVRWLFYAAIALMVGVVAFRLAVPGRLRGEGQGPVAEAIRSRSRVLAWIAVLLAVVALPARFVLQTRLLAGPGGDLAAASGQLLGSGWGAGWFLQLSALGLFIAGLLVVGRDGTRRSGWLMAGLGAALAAAVPALSGHAAAAGPWMIAVDTVHVLAAGTWVGGLACLLFVGIPSSRRAEEGASALPAVVAAFSAIALPAVATLVASGALNAIAHVRPSELFATPYGRLLLLKLVVALGAFAMGFYNWRVVRPALEREARPSLLRIPATVELVVGLAVLAITSVLVATGLP